MLNLDPKTIASADYSHEDDPRAINEVLALLDSTWLDGHLHARPTHYNVATSVVCNIKCVFCPRQTFGPEIDSGFLKAEYYDPIVPHLEASFRTGLYGLGESFLNKKFFDFLAAAKKQGTFTMTSSHGMSLKPDVIDKIIDNGLDELCVSFDGTNERTVNFLRNGADFKTVYHNVKNLIDRRRERNSETPAVVISMTISKYNMWEMKKAVQMTKDLGADQIAFSNLVLDHKEHAHVSVAGSRVFQYNLNRAMKFAKKIGVKCTYFYQNPYPYKKQPVPRLQKGVRHGCGDAWRQIILEKDGTMKPCCYLHYSLGNTKDGDLMETLNKDKAVEFRKTFVDKNYINLCKGCGQFQEISDDTTRDIFEKAKQKVRDSSFKETTRILLEEKIRYFEALAEAEGIELKKDQAVTAS